MDNENVYDSLAKRLADVLPRNEIALLYSVIRSYENDCNNPSFVEAFEKAIEHTGFKKAFDACEDAGLGYPV